jgi:hypothetical protein
VLIVGAPRPTATPSETATPPPPSPTPTPSATSTATRTPTESATPTETLQPGSGGGCHIDGGGQRGGAWAILLGASALLARSAQRVATIAAAAVLSLVRPAEAGCFGDCDGDGRIGIDDLLRQVAVVLGDRPLDDCRSADVVPDGTLSASELVFVIGTALQGCPRPVRFAAAQYVPVGSVADAAVADVDGDGVPDLVTADFYADEVRIHLGRGNGTFAAGRGLSLGPRRDGACQEDLFHPAPGPARRTRTCCRACRSSGRNDR